MLQRYHGKGLGKMLLQHISQNNRNKSTIYYQFKSGRTTYSKVFRLLQNFKCILNTKTPTFITSFSSFGISKYTLDI